MIDCFIGDAIQLKSGSPPMIVIDMNAESLLCAYVYKDKNNNYRRNLVTFKKVMVDKLNNTTTKLYNLRLIRGGNPTIDA